MIYVYALTDDSTPIRSADAVLGLDDQPIRWVGRNGVAAICSDHAAGRVAPTRENLMRHEQVAEALMAREALLPARFATTFASEPDLGRTLQQHAEELRDGLQRVRRCVEVGLRVLWSPTETPEPVAGDSAGDRAAARSGRQYLLARLEQERRRQRTQQQAERLAEQIQRPLMPLTRARWQRVLATPALLLTAAYLVDRDRLEVFRGRSEAAARQHPELRLLCTGPWPPYHFVPRLPVSEPASELRHA